MASTYADDWLIEVLANNRRRIIIRRINERTEDEIPLNAVVEDIIEAEKSQGKDQVSRNSVRVSLRQNHIPKLVKNDVITYVEDDDVISGAERYDTVIDTLSYIERSVGNEKQPGDRSHDSRSPAEFSYTARTTTEETDTSPLETQSTVRLSNVVPDLTVDVSLMVGIVLLEAVTIFILVVYIIAF
ncbi:DUF7344 domain-containing protein [Halopiger xanaduensis]|uniref:DUF7344 domain-containing protein n=1 Tax=Halopiger xanaduensis (strain DSM 18323 / JCM 14033 / SH-6) TaxID=797210 RepID=F8DD37_HALXS|nr:hypothetical protein [Halopiger xanaduensis]AEH38924.1 hypothetical protein Halxa_0321 [Halopiger xanaduensis SH-6]